MKFYRGARFIFRPIFYLLFRIKVTGREKTPKEGSYILAANHQSDMDPLLLGVVHHGIVNFMSKDELFRIPVLRSILRALGAFPVKRGNGSRQALEKAKDIVNSGGILGIFPEGTRSKTGELLKIKAGIFVIATNTNCDILPVIIKSSSKSGRPTLLRKTNIIYGDVIKNADLKVDPSSMRDLRAARELLTNRFIALKGEV